MLKRTIVAFSIAALSWTAIAAQENATVILRSGERITGDLIDMAAAGFTVRVNGENREIPTGDVAAIKFGGGDVPQRDWARAAGGQHVAVLRNGQTVSGQLIDVGGRTPLRITFRTDGGERDLNSGEISHIVLARPTAAAAPTTGSTPGSTEVTVSAQQPWTATGIRVRQGEWLTFNSTGEIRLSADENDVATASGSLGQRRDARAPMPNTLAGALIGRIGSSRPFGIGQQNRFQAPATGELFLGINDSHHSDNQGSFQVQIETTSGVRRR